MKVLFLIPARGGSKGLPGKNIKPLNGKPLIYYTIDAARFVSNDADICISTDSAEIKQKVEAYGLAVHFLRPHDLSLDNTSMESVIAHAIDFYERERGTKYDYLVLLQPSSPLRTGKHIQEALTLIKNSTELIVSVKETDSNPYYVLFEENNAGFLEKSKNGNFTRRQDCPVVYELNGAIYIVNVNAFKMAGLAKLNKEKYVMDKHLSVDIDDWVDFNLAQLLLSQKRTEN